MDYDDGDGCWRSLLIGRFSINFFQFLIQIAKKEFILRKEINTKLTPIPNSENSLRTVTSTRHFDEGVKLLEVKTDTLYAEKGKVTLKPDIKTSKLLSDENYRSMFLIVFVMILYVTMVYGPIAAFLVELFPTKIRYTS